MSRDTQKSDNALQSHVVEFQPQVQAVKDRLAALPLDAGCAHGDVKASGKLQTATAQTFIRSERRPSVCSARHPVVQHLQDCCNMTAAEHRCRGMARGVSSCAGLCDRPHENWA